MSFLPSAWYVDGGPQPVVPGVSTLTAANSSGATVGLTIPSVIDDHSGLLAGATVAVFVSEAGSSSPGTLSDGTNTYTLAASQAEGAAGGVAVGAGASIDPNATYATAIGYNASVGPHGQNSVAIGSNSVANEPNTVSFGSPGNTRRLTNVSDGVNNTDAANYGQVKRAYAGVAMAFAMTAENPSLNPGEQAVSAGVGAFKSETGFSVRYEARPTSQVFVGAGVAVSDQGDVGGSAGIGFKW